MLVYDSIKSLLRAECGRDLIEIQPLHYLLARKNMIVNGKNYDYQLWVAEPGLPDERLELIRRGSNIRLSINSGIDGLFDLINDASTLF